MKNKFLEMGKKILRIVMLCGTVLLCAVAPELTANAGYSGISVDGDFADWEDVQKYPGAEGVGEVACVFDGDWVYIYISEPVQSNSAAWSGTSSNGKFAIVTDLGKTTLIQLTNTDGVPGVSGVDGAVWNHSDTAWGLPGYYWEIAIPVSSLEEYNQTISFGHYEPNDQSTYLYVTDVANLAGDTVQETGESVTIENPGGSAEGIVYDGSFDDWAYYPHQVIQYTGSGTHEDVVDAQGAVYTENGILYGHVETAYPVHMAASGKGFTTGMSIQINGDQVFSPRMIAVDSDGNINWMPQLSDLPQGTYEFYMVDIAGWSSATNISEWVNSVPGTDSYTNTVYGKMIVEIGPSQHDAEYWIDISAVAARFGLDAGDAKTLAAQFINLGNSWVTTAGTSSGPIVGIALCMSVVACGMIRKRRAEVGKTA